MRDFSTSELAILDADVTRPRWFVRMGFETVVRLTTAETITWAAQGGSFVNADMEVALSENPTLTIFNALGDFGVTVLTDGTAGRSLKIWQAYKASGESSTLAGYAEPVLLFDGQMAEAEIGEFVTIRSKQWGSLFTPRHYVQAPAFNHLPKRGDVIEMPNQKVILE